MSYEALYGQLEWPTDTREQFPRLSEMQKELRDAQDPFKSAIADGLEWETYDRPRSIWDWIIAMASPTAEDQGSPDPTPTPPPSLSEEPSTVAMLRSKIESDYDLPKECIVLRRRGGKVAGGRLSIEKLRDDYTSNYYKESETLRSLSKTIGERYGLGPDCVQFRDPNKKGGPVKERLYHGKTKVGTMLESYRAQGIAEW